MLSFIPFFLHFFLPPDTYVTNLVVVKVIRHLWQRSPGRQEMITWHNPMVSVKGSDDNLSATSHSTYRQQQVLQSSARAHRLSVRTCGHTCRIVNVYVYPTLDKYTVYSLLLFTLFISRPAARKIGLFCRHSLLTDIPPVLSAGICWCCFCDHSCRLYLLPGCPVTDTQLRIKIEYKDTNKAPKIKDIVENGGVSIVRNTNVSSIVKVIPHLSLR